MNLFIFLFSFSLSFAGSPPGCKDLAKYLEQFESELHKKSINDCKPDMDLQKTVQALLNNRPVRDPNFLSEIACQDLSTIEVQLDQYKLELSILDGIEKLKSTITESKIDTKDKKPVAAKEAGMTFVASLNTAASLEVLLATDSGETPFVQKLKEFPQDKRKTEKDFQERLAELCKDEPKNEPDACNQNVFKPGKEASEEILRLVDSTTPNKRQIENWRKSLAIKKKNASKDEAAYSFHQMQAELTEAFEKIDKKEVMSKEHLQAIQRLDDFENAPGLSFVENLSMLKDQKKAKIASDQYFLLMGDAKIRQQYEAQSKFSVVWNEVENVVPDLTDTQRAQCSKAKSNFEDLQSCLDILEVQHKKIQGKENEPIKTKLTVFLPKLRVSVDYASALIEKEKLCLEEIKTKEVVSQACYTGFNKDRATVQDKILQLQIVKDKIGEENMQLMKYRNFALEKWGTQKCGSLSTPMDFCNDEKLLSKDASLTFSDSMKIALIFSNTEKGKSKEELEKEKEELCPEESLTKERIKHLCEFFNDTTDPTVQTNNAPESHPDGPVVAPDGRHAENNLKDAWLQGGANLLGSILPYFMPKQNPMPIQNPNLYNYHPYNVQETPNLGIADSIMFNARYHGAYGFYMPAAGYQPGTAFSSNPGISPYTSLGGNSGKYFNSR